MAIKFDLPSLPLEIGVFSLEIVSWRTLCTAHVRALVCIVVLWGGWGWVGWGTQHHWFSSNPWVSPWKERCSSTEPKTSERAFLVHIRRWRPGSCLDTVSRRWFSFMVTASKILLSYLKEALLLSQNHRFSNTINSKNSTHWDAWWSSLIAYTITSGETTACKAKEGGLLRVWEQPGLKRLKNFGHSSCSNT